MAIFYKKHRNSRGSLIVIGVALSFFLVVVSIGFVQITRLMAGFREFRNAVDSGALACAKDALDNPSVTIRRTANHIQRQLDPLCEEDSAVSLRLINRLAAASLLVEMNEYAMQNEGTSTGQLGSTTHARQFDAAVADVVSNLADQNQSRDERLAVFAEVAAANPINMLQSVLPEPSMQGWESAYLHPGTASNVFIERKQIPVGYPADSLPLSTINIKGETRQYIAGYMPIPQASTQFIRPSSRTYFVPLRPGLKPHLVHGREFQASLTPPSDIVASYCIANALCAPALARLGSDQQFGYTANAVAEGQDTGYPAQLPAGFIRIEVSPRLARPVRLTDYVNDPVLKEIIERLKQRVWEISPSWRESVLSNDLNIALLPGKKVIIRQQNTIIGPAELYSQPDGNRSLPPVYTEDGTRFQWIPSTGHNGLLGVLEIQATQEGRQ